MPTGDESFDDPLHERLIAWDRKIQAEQAARIARYMRLEPFRRARNVKVRRLARVRQEKKAAQKARAARTLAERQDIYAERKKVRALFPDWRLRRAMALTLRRQGKTYREIGQVVGCGEDRARALVIQADEYERWRRGGR